MKSHNIHVGCHSSLSTPPLTVLDLFAGCGGGRKASAWPDWTGTATPFQALRAGVRRFAPITFMVFPI